MAILGVSPNFHSGIAMAGLTSLQRLAVPCGCGCCDGDGAAGASAEAGDPKRSSGCEIPVLQCFNHQLGLNHELGLNQQHFDGF
jgi:hypothetical protein